MSVLRTSCRHDPEGGFGSSLACKECKECNAELAATLDDPRRYGDVTPAGQPTREELLGALREAREWVGSGPASWREIDAAADLRMRIDYLLARSVG